MYQAQRSNDYIPGTWKEAGTSASFTCPNCGQLAVLTDHDISDNGEVSPSVVCPHDECTFHDRVTLVGWKGSICLP